MQLFFCGCGTDFLLLCVYVQIVHKHTDNQLLSQLKLLLRHVNRTYYKELCKYVKLHSCHLLLQEK